MDNLDYFVIELIVSFMDNNSKISFFRVNRYIFDNFFYQNRDYLRKFSITQKNLCFTCETFCGAEGHLIYLCKCIGNYPVQHHQCTILNKFYKYTKITCCPMCGEKTMIFLKEPKHINMI